MSTCMTCLLVIYSKDCLIVIIIIAILISITIRAPCPSSDQRRKVTKVLRRAGAPHTRRTMSLYVLYNKFLQILCCIATAQQHQTKIFRRPILRHRPIRTPRPCGSLKKPVHKLKQNLQAVSNVHQTYRDLIRRQNTLDIRSTLLTVTAL